MAIFHHVTRGAVLAIVGLAASFTPSANADELAKVLALRPVSSLLSNYNCAKSVAASRHVTQVINGVVHEWAESFTEGADGLQIHCINKSKPTPGALSAADATALLEASRKIGAEISGSADSRERSQDATEAAILEDIMSRAKPAELLRPKSATLEQMQSATENAASAASETSAPIVTLPAPTQGGKQSYGIFRWGIDGTGKTRTRLPPGEPTPSTKDKEKPAELERPFAVGVDERQRVVNPVFPANIVGRLYTEYADGSAFICTATLVSQFVALTAGHCLHSRDHGGYATRVIFVPQQTQNTFGGTITRPHSFKFANSIAVSSRWTQMSGGTTILPTDSRHDYGVINFSTAWTFTGTFAPIVYNSTASDTLNIGYPGRVQDTDGNEGEWFDSSVENTRSINTLRSFQVREFLIDVSGGNSGGAFLSTDGSNLHFSGIVSYGGDDLSGGVWLGGVNETVFRSYVSWTPSNSAPTRISSELRAPLILTSQFDGGESYLRFFNNSPSSGTVILRFYDLDGLDIGGWQSPSIAPFASRQFVMANIEQAAGLRIGDNIVLSTKISSTFTGLFQHVAWNVEGESLTNLSGCSNGLSSNISTAINVHSSLLEDVYPSYIILHSLETQTTNITADVYDSVTGARVGGAIFSNVPGNASGIVSMTDIEDLMDFTPNSNQYHLNIVLSGNTAAYLQHQVENEDSGVTTNFTSMCKM